MEKKTRDALVRMLKENAGPTAVCILGILGGAGFIGLFLYVLHCRLLSACIF